MATALVGTGTSPGAAAPTAWEPKPAPMTTPWSEVVNSGSPAVLKADATWVVDAPWAP